MAIQVKVGAGESFRRNVSPVLSRVLSEYGAVAYAYRGRDVINGKLNGLFCRETCDNCIGNDCWEEWHVHLSFERGTGYYRNYVGASMATEWRPDVRVDLAGNLGSLFELRSSVLRSKRSGGFFALAAEASPAIWDDEDGILDDDDDDEEE